MQETEFEKRLKQLMETFHVQPSDSVWEKINRRINGDKRKKRPFILFLLLSLLTAGYFMYQAVEKQQQSGVVTSKSKVITPSANDSGTLLTFKQDEKNSVIKNQSSTATHKAKTLKERNIKQSPAHQTNKTVIKPSLAVKKNSINIETNDQNNELKKLNTETTKSSNRFSEANRQPAYKNPLSEQQNISNDTTKAITGFDLNKNLNYKISSLITQNKNDNTAETAVKKSNKKNYINPNWQFGITAFYGRSNEIEKQVDFNKSIPQYMNVDPGMVDTTSAISNKNKHPFSSSIAYKFGAVVQKKIAKNSFISTGLNFVHLSAKTVVGTQHDSSLVITASNNFSTYAVNGYYRPGTSTNYHNYFNFIELPVFFQQNFLHRKNIFLGIDAGLSMCYLLSSRALIYNHYSDVYFLKNDLLRKTQFQFTGGLKLNINTNKRSAFFIAPQFEYNFSGLLKNNNTGNYHLINYGLRAGFILHKK